MKLRITPPVILVISSLALADQAVPTATEATPANGTQVAPVQDPSLKATGQTATPQQTGTPQQTATTQQAPATEPALEKAPEHPAHGILTEVNVGTQGIGLSIGYEFNQHFKLRMRGAYLAYDYDDDWGNGADGLTAKGKMDFDGSNVGLILDYHPFGGRFHVSGGLNFADTKVKIDSNLNAATGADGSEGTYDFGGVTYRAAGNSGNIHGKYSWNTVQPYLGIGWSSDGDGDRSLYFSIDLGVNFIGNGSLSVGASDNIQAWNGTDWEKASNATIEHSVREEGKDFFKIADDLFVYPVLQIGMGYRF